MSTHAVEEPAEEDFRSRWQAFMEGGWERLVADDPGRIEAVRRSLRDILPVHPDAFHVHDLIDAVTEPATGVDERHLFAALLEMERHGHVELTAGWVCRPPPRVPRRGHCLEDMFYKFGYEEARALFGD